MRKKHQSVGGKKKLHGGNKTICLGKLKEINAKMAQLHSQMDIR